MKLRSLFSALALLVALAFSACDATAPSPPLTLTPLVTSTAVGQHSGLVNRRAIVVTDQQAFADLWAEIHRSISSTEPMPIVDFSKEIVVGFAMGEQPSSGFSVRLRGAARDRSGVVVAVQEETPAANCVLLPVITAPIDLARLSRTGESIRFANETTIKGC
jgi:hypothetical protein